MSIHPLSPSVMHPVKFQGCFGWLHTAAASDTAIVLCSGLRRDASNAHRPFRILADQLAAEGYPTLRFDYMGTGDSCDAEGGEYWAIWLGNVLAAADYARAVTGARQVVLIGLRIGAALATQAAAERDDVIGLILLDPILRGRAYIAQLMVEARLRTQEPPDFRDGLLLDELCLTGETVRRIKQQDSREVLPPQGCSVAIFSQAQSSSIAGCVETWRSAGISVTSQAFSGLESLLQPAHLAGQSPPDFMPIVSWLRAGFPVEQIDKTTAVTAPPAVMLRHDGCVETPLRFGQQCRLFGILCRPDSGTQSDFAVIICNPGGDPHHGYARFSVEFARRLAASGITSLRFDFAGLGDSVPSSEQLDDDSLDVFTVDRNADVAAALDVLEPLGFRRFALHGLCSGAFHAFQASLVDTRVAALLLINLPWFSLRREKSSPDSFARAAMTILADRRVGRLLLFAEGDAGIRPLEQHFGPAGVDLEGSGDVEVSIVSGFDHDLTGHAMRRAAADRMIAFLLRAPSLREYRSDVA